MKVPSSGEILNYWFHLPVEAAARDAAMAAEAAADTGPESPGEADVGGGWIGSLGMPNPGRGSPGLPLVS